MFFRHDFCNGEGVEHSDSKSDTRRNRIAIDRIQIPNGNISGTTIDYDFQFKRQPINCNYQ